MLFRMLMPIPFLEQNSGEGGGSGSGTGSQQGGSGSSESSQQGPTQADIEKLTGALQKERDANAAIKKAATDKGLTVEAYLQSITDSASSNQTELEKLQQQVADLTRGIETERTNAQTARIEAALSSAANNARARYSDVIVEMLKGRIELDDAGNPKGVVEAVEQLKKDKPELFRFAEGRGDGGRPPRQEKDIKPGIDRLSEYYATESPTAKAG
jgi:hypothetical protein